MQQGIEELKNTHEVSLTELFDADFIRSCSSLDSFEELLLAGGFVVGSEEDFAAIPDDQWDTHVVNSTKFSSWLEMQKAATANYARKKMAFK